MREMKTLKPCQSFTAAIFNHDFVLDLHTVCPLPLLASIMCVDETHMLGRLQIDNDHLPSFALSEEWKISTGFDLHGRAERQCQVCSSAGKEHGNTSNINN